MVCKFINYHSAQPLHQKINVIANEYSRIEQRCSLAERTDSHMADFENKLRINEYPDTVIQQAKNRLHKFDRKGAPNKVSHSDSQTYVFRMPFFDNATYYRVKNVFKKYKLPVRMITNSNTLRNVIRLPQPTQQECRFSNCIIRPSGLCYRRMVVYELVCGRCNSNYIGSTIRFLHTRVCEHISKENSAVFQHKRCCLGDFTASILATGFDVSDLRFKEALLIRRRQPLLNRREELIDIDCLTSGIDLRDSTKTLVAKEH